MKLLYTDIFVLPLPEGHHFPMKKYRSLSKRIADSGLVDDDLFYISRAASDDELTAAHDPLYLSKFINGNLNPKELIRLRLPWTKQPVERSRMFSGATIDACIEALENGIGINLAGGTHHAFRDYGEGYCVFNDSAVAARNMVRAHRVKRVLIIDCDVHQGNGTASILKDDENIFTFSIHGRKNYPHDKEKSDPDIALEDKTTDSVYLDLLSNGISQAVDALKPDLVIYLAGADPFFDDKFVRLSLTKKGLIKRDRLVFDYCIKSGIPVAVTMAVGYAKQVEDKVDIHY